MALSNRFIEKQRAALLNEKERIESQIEKKKKYPDYGFDEEDNIQEISDYETNLSIEEQLQILLKKIKAALKAIDDGTYGQCAKCNKAIEEGRLAIMPYANLCVTCQSGKKR